MSIESLESYRIAPGLEVFYISDFLSRHEQDSLWNSVYAQDRRWIQLKNRRLQAHPSQLLNGNTLVTSALPAFLTHNISQKFEELELFSNSTHRRPNHVLINEYQALQGIDPHEDGNAYFPLVVTISLGSSCVYNLYDKSPQRKTVAEILQEPGSCMITRAPAYADYLHGISEVDIDSVNCKKTLNWHMLRPEYQQESLVRTTRLSLTYRDVIKERAIFKLGRGFSQR